MGERNMQNNRRKGTLLQLSLVGAALVAVSCLLAGGTSTAASAKPISAPAVKYAQIQANHAAQVVKLVNKERAKAGLKPLIVHSNLTKMAKNKVIDMYQNKYFSHTSPKFGSPFDMMDSYHISFTYAGENLAKGQRTPSEVVKDWMNSPGHRANMLNSHYTLIGVGYYNGYWSEEFVGK
ncbi:CAP domain-containing protein [Paenibacillus caui]|uniref:CAP domain-containing protein n=1 Tax=Paenibacillus caui TaxID=2873927 RepID=UPI001F480AFA|nr:CAP domain-containing protein [Paenibacillus caui]